MNEPEGKAWFGGRLQLQQALTGHRVGTDAALLAAAAPAGFGGLCVDLGAGVGAVGLAVAALHRTSSVRLVEIDQAAAALAAANVAANGLEARVAVIVADVLADRRARRQAGLEPASADLVLTNPPYLDARVARISPDAARAQAHVMPDGGLGLWMATACDLVRPGGHAVAIHRADALPALLSALDGFGAIAVRPVQPRDAAAAVRILVQAKRGSRAPFRLLPPLVLHGEGGAFTAIAEALHRGEAVLDWTD
jgi:tRNA1(Val) A37 N6-methylase TrmN6